MKHICPNRLGGGKDCVFRVHQHWQQKVDIFTKPLDGPRFESLHKTIGVGIIPWTLSLVWHYFVQWCILALKVSHVQVRWCFFYKFCFVLAVFLLLILLYMFCFLVCWKIQKPIKIENSLKSLIACVVYITCEFGLVPLY